MMKTKIATLIITAALLLAACGGSTPETSDPLPLNPSADTNVSIPSVDTSMSISNPDSDKSDSSVEASGDESQADPDVSKDTQPNVSKDNETSKGNDTSKPDTSVTPPVLDGKAPSGQNMTVSGADEDDINDFLEGALFVGDSLTEGFKLYVGNYGDMPSVDFFAASSYGYQSALKDKATSSIHPKLEGKSAYIWDAVEYYGSDRIFINFGLNDFGYISDSKLKTCLETICQNILDVNPGAEIAFLSCGFFTKSGQTNKYGFSNDKVREKNEVVLKFCNENGFDFIDVSWAYSDGAGNLDEKYSYDKYCHLGYQNYNYWEDILKAYAADKLNDNYENIPTMILK